MWERVVAPDAPAPARVLPDGCVNVVFVSDGRAFVAGPDTGPVLHDLAADTVVTGLRFEVGRAGTALGMPMSELRDRRVELDALWGRATASETAERLALAAGTPDRLAVLQAACAANAPGGGAAGPDPLVVAAVRSLGRPGASVAATAHDLAVSERELRRRFQHAVGYGPKTLDRVLRFRRLLALAGGRPAATEPSLARAAAELGYADQAHLTRSVRELSGLTPSELLATWGSA